MTAEPAPAAPSADNDEADGWPQPTREDGDALVRSFIWFDLAVGRGEFEQYRGRHVAVLGEQVIDADPDYDELYGRLAARRDSIPLGRVAFRHLPGDDEETRLGLQWWPLDDPTKPNRLAGQEPRFSEPPIGGGGPTEADADALFASLLWYGDADGRGELDDYRDTHVAVFGERVLDADPDYDELCRRLAALGDAVPRYRVLTRFRETRVIQS